MVGLMRALVKLLGQMMTTVMTLAVISFLTRTGCPDVVARAS
jgi:hypothetical protein